MNQYLFYDDLDDNFEGFLPNVKRLVIPEFSIGNQKFESENEYGQWYHKKFPENIYVNYLIKNNGFDQYFGGMSISEIKNLTNIVEEGEVKSIVFDWDRTLSICEGFLQIGPLSNTINISIDVIIENLVPYILGDEERISILSELFSVLQKKGVRIFILTNNREKYFQKILSEAFRILNVPSINVRLVQQPVNTRKYIIKSRLLQTEISKMEIDNSEKNELMQGYFGKDYDNSRTKLSSPIALLRTSSLKNGKKQKPYPTSRKTTKNKQTSRKRTRKIYVQQKTF